MCFKNQLKGIIKLKLNYYILLKRKLYSETKIYFNFVT